GTSSATSRGPGRWAFRPSAATSSKTATCWSWTATPRGAASASPPDACSSTARASATSRTRSCATAAISPRTDSSSSYWQFISSQATSWPGRTWSPAGWWRKRRAPRCWSPPAKAGGTVIREAEALSAAALAVFLALSFLSYVPGAPRANLGGPVGNALADAGLHALGLAAYLLPLYLGYLTVVLFRHDAVGF